MSEPVTATWSIELHCECPKCEEYVDLLEYPDFWDGRGDMAIGEHHTDQTRNMDVSCPKCGCEFKVDCEY